jgi:hypothetical protein
VQKKTGPRARCFSREQFPRLLRCETDRFDQSNGCPESTAAGPTPRTLTLGHQIDRTGWNWPSGYPRWIDQLESLRGFKALLRVLSSPSEPGCRRYAELIPRSSSADWLKERWPWTAPARQRKYLDGGAGRAGRRSYACHQASSRPERIMNPRQGGLTKVANPGRCPSPGLPATCYSGGWEILKRGKHA